MSDPSYELQAAIVSTLKASPPAAGGRVYDNVPPDVVFPYVSLGPCQVIPDKAECIDGTEVYPQLDVWSRATSFGEIKLVVRDVLRLLDDQPLAVTGFNLVVFQYQEVRYTNDPDGLTRHAAITFHGILTPT